MVCHFTISDRTEKTKSQFFLKRIYLSVMPVMFYRPRSDEESSEIGMWVNEAVTQRHNHNRDQTRDQPLKDTFHVLHSLSTNCF